MKKLNTDSSEKNVFNFMLLSSDEKDAVILRGLRERGDTSHIEDCDEVFEIERVEPMKSPSQNK